MSSSVHRVLGADRIKEICRKHGLTAEDEKIIDEILERWETLTGQHLQKMKVVDELVANNPHVSRITKAILEITIEFSTKAWFSNLARPDDQGRFFLLEIEEEECPSGGKHRIRTKELSIDENVAWCEKCGNRWRLR